MRSPAPVLQDLDEGTPAQLVEREARPLQGFLLGYRAAVDRPQEIVEETLAGRRVIKDFSDERRLSGFLDEVAEALGGSVEAFEEEGKNRGVAGHELRGMEIPSLIEGVDQRVPDVLGVQPPGAVDDRAVLLDLLGCRG